MVEVQLVLQQVFEVSCWSEWSEQVRQPPGVLKMATFCEALTISGCAAAGNVLGNLWNVIFDAVSVCQISILDASFSTLCPTDRL